MQRARRSSGGLPTGTLLATSQRVPSHCSDRRISTSAEVGTVSAAPSFPLAASRTEYVSVDVMTSSSAVPSSTGPSSSVASWITGPPPSMVRLS